MRSLLQPIINTLLATDTDAVVSAEHGRPSPGRVSQRNGYRHRDLDTRVGIIDIAVPKLRKDSYLPERLLERDKHSESALITLVADCYIAEVSTRRTDKLVKTLGIDGLSKPQVSPMAADLVAHGLPGIRLVTSDTHAGPHEAIAANLPDTSCPRCRTHYAFNLMGATPKSLWPAVNTSFALVPLREPPEPQPTESCSSYRPDER